jgi:hypothetical protein
MATHAQILPLRESGRQSIVVDKHTGFFRRFFAPVVIQKSMSEKDIKQYLYPDSAVNIQSNVVAVSKKS